MKKSKIISARTTFRTLMLWARAQIGPGVISTNHSKMEKLYELVSNHIEDTDADKMHADQPPVECQDLAFVLVDFARLVTIHVISLNRHWKEEDVIPGAEHWHDIWSPQQGPDWIDETSAAIEEVHRWRAEVLDGSGSGHLPIVKHLSDEQRAFNGFGRHLSHDVVYSLGIHPGMPASDVCRDDVLFSQWTSQQYLIRVANIPNSENPFAFNDISNQRYLSESVLVYHKQCVYVPAELNDRLARAGMYDPSHIIGVTPDPKAPGRPGRRKKERNGLPGRPAKQPRVQALQDRSELGLWGVTQEPWSAQVLIVSIKAGCRTQQAPHGKASSSTTWESALGTYVRSSPGILSRLDNGRPHRRLSRTLATSRPLASGAGFRTTIGGSKQGGGAVARDMCSMPGRGVDSWMRPGVGISCAGIVCAMTRVREAMSERGTYADSGARNCICSSSGPSAKGSSPARGDVTDAMRRRDGGGGGARRPLVRYCRSTGEDADTDAGVVRAASAARLCAEAAAAERFLLGMRDQDDWADTMGDGCRVRKWREVGLRWAGAQILQVSAGAQIRGRVEGLLSCYCVAVKTESGAFIPSAALRSSGRGDDET
ncbi:hypothetical protein POSPLADRAFT_1068194 [Postia placenta MAD-698-R-SB12]|uniref:Uncharacterized protein n=1 Tax=Postia placenta MAD-698-R-SB12 TaxID=670580 RepID=A0A1X6MIP3_9APHY|nr:hypothetical protein POSPLADRAFT_1068194 [Postia placenta MAD-698-R-SB12]OSX56317.1 hypothetical protein POSPLADRAFT_1068194 [Postia placenta MAD-698-R-SB12]